VVSLPPQSDFQAYRGTLDGSLITISLRGEIGFEPSKSLREVVDLAVEDLEQPEQNELAPEAKTAYMVLAKHSTISPSKSLTNHLNIWLNPDQFRFSITSLQEMDEIEELAPEFEFERHRFKYEEEIISFHNNGKVISQSGYSVYAPIISRAIMANLPFSDFDLIIGQDEVGSGERIGPLVVSTVAVTPKQLVDLQLIGVKDSKLVPRSITPNMANWIREFSTITNTVSLLPPQFNALRLEGNLSIADILSQTHNTAVAQLKSKLNQISTGKKRVIYLIDQYNRFEHLTNLEDDPNFEVEYKYLTGGEKHSVSIAAASILAKASRLRWMKIQQKMTGYELRRKEVNRIRQDKRSHQLLKFL